MSINSALLAGVSGLAANSAALSAISQNIANVNTIGYKRSQGEFQTMVNAQNQGAGYSAGGVMANTRNFISQAGQLQRTGSSTDLGISGAGFFVVTERAEGLTPADTRLFTRAGAFRVDEMGYLKNTAGLYLQGWPVDSDGNINADPSDLNRLRSINVGTVGGTAEATTRVQLNANLRSSQEVSAEALAVTTAGPNAYDPATNSMAMWDPELGTGVKPDFELTIPVSDSKGGQRSLAVSFLKSDTPNQWYAEIRAIPEGDVVTGAGLNNGQLRSGIVAFTQDGRLDVPAMQALGAAALFDDPENASLSFGASDSGAPAAGEFRWADELGIDNQVVTFDLNASAGGLTQYDSASVVQATLTNGTAFGNLTDIQIDDQGSVTAIFDNGVMRRIAQVTLATFPSPDNLTAVNGNAYSVSQASGTYNLKAPGSGGAGFIGASQLEASTVDLSTEFTGLITTQRAYSASSKIITTADQMLEELLMIKR
ncbi:flagellar hook-basal body complex protein [Brevundimonas sp. BAL450]|jgi:flagellar hook protein FlgE|uniref:Flagellar hook protein FlgE n=1 Tax=Brevundimonas abyssalis TAR-001 TaxID=1391729 RepID=A0A8E0KLF1_9CAUL|nr:MULTISPECIES: flagellar hook protein FlgE [Brevundimonas]MBG7615465.1 flagellar hook-basal body complex protein [Brevundimonas sp. BAL450]GAD57862.1 flagellar hook protein flgE [Brevundimonas abyssalis TAR-001]